MFTAVVKMSDIHYTVLYTSQKTKKSKTWHDGVLKVCPAGTKAVLVDDKGIKIDTIHVRLETITLGEQIESDRHFILIEEVKNQTQPKELGKNDIENKAITEPAGKITQTSVRMGLRTGIKRKKTGFVPPRMVKQPKCDDNLTSLPPTQVNCNSDDPTAHITKDNSRNFRVHLAEVISKPAAIPFSTDCGKSSQETYEPTGNVEQWLTQSPNNGYSHEELTLHDFIQTKFKSSSPNLPLAGPWTTFGGKGSPGNTDDNTRTSHQGSPQVRAGSNTSLSPHTPVITDKQPCIYNSKHNDEIPVLASNRNYSSWSNKDLQENVKHGSHTMVSTGSNVKHGSRTMVSTGSNVKHGSHTMVSTGSNVKHGSHRMVSTGSNVKQQSNRRTAQQILALLHLPQENTTEQALMAASSVSKERLIQETFFKDVEKKGDTFGVSQDHHESIQMDTLDFNDDLSKGKKGDIHIDSKIHEHGQSPGTAMNCDEEIVSTYKTPKSESFCNYGICKDEGDSQFGEDESFSVEANNVHGIPDRTSTVKLRESRTDTEVVPTDDDNLGIDGDMRLGLPANVCQNNIDIDDGCQNKIIETPAETMINDAKDPKMIKSFGDNHEFEEDGVNFSLTFSPLSEVSISDDEDVCNHAGSGKCLQESYSSQSYATNGDTESNCSQTKLSHENHANGVQCAPGKPEYPASDDEERRIDDVSKEASTRKDADIFCCEQENLDSTKAGKDNEVIGNMYKRLHGSVHPESGHQDVIKDAKEQTGSMPSGGTDQSLKCVDEMAQSLKCPDGVDQRLKGLDGTDQSLKNSDGTDKSLKCLDKTDQSLKSCLDATDQSLKCLDMTDQSLKCLDMTDQSLKCPDGTDQSLKCLDGTDQSLKCPDGTDQSLKCLDGTDQSLKCPDGTDQRLKGLDGTDQSLKNSDGTDKSLKCLNKTDQSLKSCLDATDQSLKCLDGTDQSLKCLDMTDQSLKCLDMTDQSLKCPDGTDQSLKCLDGTDQSLKCPDGTDQSLNCLDGTDQSLKCLDGTDQSLKCPDGTDQSLKCPDGTDQSLKCLDDLCFSQDSAPCSVSQESSSPDTVAVGNLFKTSGNRDNMGSSVQVVPESCGQQAPYLISAGVNGAVICGQPTRTSKKESRLSSQQCHESHKLSDHEIIFDCSVNVPKVVGNGVCNKAMRYYSAGREICDEKGIPSHQKNKTRVKSSSHFGNNEKMGKFGLDMIRNKVVVSKASMDSHPHPATLSRKPYIRQHRSPSPIQDNVDSENEVEPHLAQYSQVLGCKVSASVKRNNSKGDHSSLSHEDHPSEHYTVIQESDMYPLHHDVSGDGTGFLSANRDSGRDWSKDSILNDEDEGDWPRHSVSSSDWPRHSVTSSDWPIHSATNSDWPIQTAEQVFNKQAFMPQSKFPETPSFDSPSRACEDTVDFGTGTETNRMTDSALELLSQNDAAKTWKETQRVPCGRIAADDCSETRFYIDTSGEKPRVIKEADCQLMGKSNEISSTVIERAIGVVNDLPSYSEERFSLSHLQTNRKKVLKSKPFDDDFTHHNYGDFTVNANPNGEITPHSNACICLPSPVVCSSVSLYTDAARKHGDENMTTHTISTDYGHSMGEREQPHWEGEQLTSNAENNKLNLSISSLGSSDLELSIADDYMSKCCEEPCGGLGMGSSGECITKEVRFTNVGTTLSKANHHSQRDVQCASRPDDQIPDGNSLHCPSKLHPAVTQEPCKASDTRDKSHAEDGRGSKWGQYMQVDSDEELESLLESSFDEKYACMIKKTDPSSALKPPNCQWGLRTHRDDGSIGAQTESYDVSHTSTCDEDKGPQEDNLVPVVPSSGALKGQFKCPLRGTSAMSKSLSRNSAVFTPKPCDSYSTSGKGSGFNSPLMGGNRSTNVLLRSKRNLCGELQFASREEVESQSTPTRKSHIPVMFHTLANYKQAFMAALREHLNILLFELARKYHLALARVDVSQISQSAGTGKSVKGQGHSGCLTCHCGVPSKLAQVRKEGPNRGRYFYACSSARDQQCKWADASPSPCPGKVQESGQRLTLKDSESLTSYVRGQHLMFFAHCHFLKKSKENNMAHMKKDIPDWVKKKNNFSPNPGEKKMFVQLSRKDSSSLFAKDDLWVVSQTLYFEPGSTFLAKSTYFGPSSTNEVEVEPIAGFCPSNWPNNTSCHCIMAANISSELSYLNNLESNLHPVSVPILMTLLQGSSEERRHNTGSLGNISKKSRHDIHLAPDQVRELGEELIHSYHLNDDQSTALRRVCDMFMAESSLHGDGSPQEDGSPHGGADLNSVLLIHGVFGAGKSYLLSVVIIFLVRMFDMNEIYTPGVPFEWKILVASTTNVAVDRILQGLLKEGFEDFVRVGSMKKISKPVLPFSVHSTGSDSQELKDLQEMLRSGELTQSEKHNVRQSIEKHKLGENKKRLGSVRVVGVTCASCSAQCLENMKFPIVLIDECSQMTEPASMLPIAKFSCEKLLLVGDPKQLDPTIQGSETSTTDGLEQTLFDRLMRMGHNPVVLRTQYRCHPVISAISNNLFYDNILLNGVSAEERKPILAGLPTLCFYNVTKGQQAVDRDGSYYNMAEAECVVSLLCVLLENDVEPHNIGVITLYKSQMFKILNLLGQKSEMSEVKRVRVSTVDAFQGGEHDVIILSCVRTNNIGFIDNKKRTNVALTRAKHHLLVVGNKHNLKQNLLWEAVLSHFEAQTDSIQNYSSIQHIQESLAKNLAATQRNRNKNDAGKTTGDHRTPVYNLHITPGMGVSHDISPVAGVSHDISPVVGVSHDISPVEDLSCDSTVTVRGSYKKYQGHKRRMITLMESDSEPGNDGCSDSDEDLPNIIL